MDSAFAQTDSGRIHYPGFKKIVFENNLSFYFVVYIIYFGGLLFGPFVKCDLVKVN
jgi:hypothetical protein